jgi:epoxyqueuosine reductase
MKLHDVPPAENLPQYKNIPSHAGNRVNGLGEKEKRRPSRVFHALGRPGYPLAGLNAFFLMNNTAGIVWQAIKYRWRLRNSNGPIAKMQLEVEDKSQMAKHIKDKAIEFGAGVVGITDFIETDSYDDIDNRFPNAICIGNPMQREEMLHVPHARAAVEVQRVYGEVADVAIKLAAHIRSLGWAAYAYGDPRSTDILQIPLAIRAGLGELGKHGSIITKEFGSNLRLSTVATNMPLSFDQPIDIGVEDLCASCRRCTVDCPPSAISDEKQWVRGEYRWYVDFDKCVPYFSANFGCAICQEVCPWSEPGRGPSLSEKLLSKRDSKKTK